MGKLYLKSTGEFIKDCSQGEYIDLSFSSPGEYYFIDNSFKSPTIQDLNNFANLSIERNISAKEKNIPDKQKSMLTAWSEIFCIIACIIALIGFLIWFKNVIG